MKHAAIIPLIGGEALASTEAFGGELPRYVLSYEPFAANESHLRNRWKNEVNWYLLDKGESGRHLLGLPVRRPEPVLDRLRIRQPEQQMDDRVVQVHPL